MPESAAERQRRYRRHKAGDHGLCIPGRCPAVTPTVTRDNEPDRVTLGPSGQRLWAAMTDGGPLPAMQAVLLLEACRIADRLDKLDAQLRGEDWLRFDVDETGAEVTVIVDRVLSEARQQATALKQIVAELRQTAGGGKAKPAATGKGAGIADLTARIASRRSSPAS
ncbi:hypothetical protein SAMN05216215_109715 [Saccharopolyspora shandongensis]|uniref:Terminase small subunit n=1 Tax=Saccharopolyspora shandongensis TaxID=418495 RepID=A0A1H3TZ09_9PSEU|nr:hypothetical protein [Saccharopolyspora shandongensis]SDZ55277.1 hypothetical protein SAMN05216215_109715 [Saccharopolyspora shandongensis]